MPAMPPPGWLRTFEAAARLMSFTEAAHELHLTQSAVSQHIRLLEDRLGHALFHRLPRGLCLTEAGKAYLPVVRDAFERLQLGTEQVFGRARGMPLTLRATPGFIDLWLIARLPRLFDAHPGLEIRITSTIWNTDLVETGVDMEVRYGDGHWPGLESERLTTETLFPVCGAALARELGSDPARLADVRLLHTDGFLNGWAEWLRLAGVDDRVDGNAGCHFDTAIPPIRLAAADVGVALGRTSLVHDALERGELVAPFEQHLQTDESFHAVWPANVPVHPETDLLLTWLRSEATTASATQAGPRP